MRSPLAVPVRWLSGLTARGVARLAVLATVAGGVSLAAVGRRAFNQPAGPMPPLAARDTDSVRVYGPKKFETPSGKASVLFPP